MKIMICGSMAFAKEMIKAKNQLEQLGHEVIVPCDTELHVEKPHLIDDFEEDHKHCIENQIMETCYKLVEESEAILVLNYPKNNIDGYVGTATLMDIAIARHFRKKFFLLHEPPNPKDHRWAHEVRILQPIILNGDLTKIK